MRPSYNIKIMRIEKTNDKIIIENADYFCPSSTLECGQVFRFKKVAEESYTVFSLDKHCKLYKTGDSVIIESDSLEYFYNYFDLGTNYETIVKSLSKFPELAASLQLGKGIRILKQDLFETIISFIISANNNIPRIKGIIERACAKFGGKVSDDFYAFPTLEQLYRATSEDFRNLGAGFRSEYLVETVDKLVKSDILDRLKTLTSSEAIKLLCTLKGVGPKVADCVLLFGMARTDSYPVDTWIFKANKSDILDTKDKVRDFYINKYGNLAGYAQQYIFYRQITEK